MPRFLVFPSFLPSCHFLTMYFPLLVSRANNGQEGGRVVRKEKGRRGRWKKRHEEKGVDSAHPPLIRRLFLRFMVYTCKTTGKGGRTTEESIEERERRQQGRINWR